jgi:drug/metabolite transporter (DMT)-like permease
LISYSTYVTGAAAIAATSFGELLLHEIRSPWALAAQMAMIAGLIALGSIDWKKRLQPRR